MKNEMLQPFSSLGKEIFCWDPLETSRSVPPVEKQLHEPQHILGSSGPRVLVFARPLHPPHQGVVSLTLGFTGRPARLFSCSAGSVPVWIVPDE